MTCYLFLSSEVSMLGFVLYKKFGVTCHKFVKKNIFIYNESTNLCNVTLRGSVGSLSFLWQIKSVF